MSLALWTVLQNEGCSCVNSFCHILPQVTIGREWMFVIPQNSSLTWCILKGLWNVNIVLIVHTGFTLCMRLTLVTLLLILLYTNKYYIMNNFWEQQKILIAKLSCRHGFVHEYCKIVSIFVIQSLWEYKIHDKEGG